LHLQRTRKRVFREVSTERLRGAVLEGWCSVPEYRWPMPERDVPSEKPQSPDDAPAKDAKPGHEVEDAAEQELEYPADETNEG
jgi:hypothetical protein